MLLCSHPAFSQLDKKATENTKRLYDHLNNLSLSMRNDQKILIGHQNAFTQGQGWSRMNNDVGSDLKSDMHEVAGIHPAVFGLDFLEIGHWNKDFIIEKIKEVDNKGGVITLSWHMPTLIDDGKGDGSFYDSTTKVVTHILPGGKAHQKFLNELNRLILFLKEIKDIPVIFRPFHEHNGSWFWWGKNHCTKSGFIQLWQFTVNYLQKNNIHNLLYAYSPDQIHNDYLDRYPGDDFVDILGVDTYFKSTVMNLWNLGLNPLSEWKNDVVWLLNEATKRNKIPAITEFGEEGIKTEKFWTDYFGWPLEREGIKQITGNNKLPGRGVAYILLWRNDTSNMDHFFGPIPHHKENDNFKSLLTKKIFLGL